MNASEVLVVILASALALFLVLGIVLLVILIRISRQIYVITSSAKETVNHIQNFVSTVSKAAAPAVTSKFIVEQIQKIIERHKAKQDKKD